MFKRISLVIALVAALVLTATAYARTSASTVLPDSVTRINFVPGTSSYTFTTNLTLGSPQAYVLGVSSRQIIYVTMSGNAGIELLDPLNNILQASTSQPGPWGVAAPMAGDYTLVLDGQGTITVSIYIPPAWMPQQYSGIALFPPQRIRFAPGSIGYGFSLDLQQGQPRAFVLGIMAGQQFNVKTEGNVTAVVLGVDSNPLRPAHIEYGLSQYAIPVTGDYTMILSGQGPSGITLVIPALGTNPPPSSGPLRIRFRPGAVSSTVVAYPQPGLPSPEYVLGIAAAQTLYISTTGVVSNIVVYDSLGNLLTAAWTPYGALAFAIPLTGDYRIVVYGSGTIGITFYIPPL